MRWSDRKGVARLVAGDTTATVGAQVLEKGIGGGVRWPVNVEIGETPIGIGELLKPGHDETRV
jgi:hypothetical protein